MRKAFQAIRGLVERIKRTPAATSVGVTPLSALTRQGQTNASRSGRRPIATSTASGGLVPGIDISDSAALQGMDDLEYVQRMKHFG
jgi:hypothetical protein